MRLAVVGSTQFAKDREATVWATDLINTIFDDYWKVLDTVVSGGAKGIDSLGARLAEERGFKVVEYLPTNARWAPNGYMDRNLLIAQNCDELVRISHHASKTYGSGWTADRAEEMGKPVHRYIYEGE